jgi:hypothetical protein
MSDKNSLFELGKRKKQRCVVAGSIPIWSGAWYQSATCCGNQRSILIPDTGRIVKKAFFSGRMEETVFTIDPDVFALPKTPSMSWVRVFPTKGILKLAEC